MRIRGLGKLRTVTQQLRNRFTPGGLILFYHRVSEVSSDPFKLCVKPRHFAEQMEVLRKYAQPMPLQQLVQTVRDGKCPNRAVAVTFDDGYADNLYEAKPLLERYDIPATVFVTTGNLGSQREFWWDELGRLLLQPGKLPKTLRLSINGYNHEWDLSEAADYSEDDYQRDRTWHYFLPRDEDPSPRQRIYRSLCQMLQPLLPDDRQQLMSEILAWSGAEATGRPTHYSLSTAEVRTLEQGGLIEVGAHTVKHPFLSALPPAMQSQEIQQSKSRLEELLGHPVNNFAYPHGDFTETTVTLVREAGFVSACSTIAKKVGRNANCFQLPRVGVADWDGERFSRQLSHWIGIE